MLPHPDIGDVTLDRQLFTYLEQPMALVPAAARLKQILKWSSRTPVSGYESN